jgi:peptide/nickel transport system ATP-binding protein
VPIADTKVKRKRIVLEGDIPSAVNPPPGCPFQTRCRHKSSVRGNKCETELPEVKTLAGGHQIKCHLSEKMLAKMEPVIALSES